MYSMAGAKGASSSMPLTPTTRGTPPTTVPAKAREPESDTTVMRIRLS